MGCAVLRSGACDSLDAVHTLPGNLLELVATPLAILPALVQPTQRPTHSLCGGLLCGGLSVAGPAPLLPMQAAVSYMCVR
jgi:hypothetical protein